MGRVVLVVSVVLVVQGELGHLTLDTVSHVESDMAGRQETHETHGSTSFNGETQDYQGPSILISDNEDFSDITQLLNCDQEGSHRTEAYNYSKYSVTICNNKVGWKILAAMVTVFTFFLIICFLVYREALATQRAITYQVEERVDNIDPIDMIVEIE